MEWCCDDDDDDEEGGDDDDDRHHYHHRASQKILHLSDIHFVEQKQSSSKRYFQNFFVWTNSKKFIFIFITVVITLFVLADILYCFNNYCCGHEEYNKVKYNDIINNDDVINDDNNNFNNNNDDDDNNK